MAGERTAKVTIEDPNNGKVSEKNLPLSSRGTFSGEVEIVGGEGRNVVAVQEFWSPGPPQPAPSAEEGGLCGLLTERSHA